MTVFYTPDLIADYILSKSNREAGDTISPLKLQKLLYYCQAWHLTIFKRRLFDEDIEAWAHGPVVRSQYNRFNHIKLYDNIHSVCIESNLDIHQESRDLINDVLAVYGEHSAGYLENLTHSESPWIEARKGYQEFERCSEVISDESMIEFYSAILQRNEE